MKEYVDVIIFDKDNTLTGPYENSIHPDAARGLQSALETFGRTVLPLLVTRQEQRMIRIIRMLLKSKRHLGLMLFDMTRRNQAGWRKS
jgi:hypothetical protein